MAKIQLVKNLSGALVPLDDDDAARLGRMAAGEIIEAKVVFYRNPGFHRKFMKMLRFAYAQYHDAQADEDHLMTFEQFRAKVTILAGFSHEVFDLDGNMTLEPKSISFEKMEQDEFELVYEAVAKVLLRKILTNWRREDLDEAVETADQFLTGFVT